MIKLFTISAFFFLLQSGSAADVKYLFYHVNKNVYWQHDGLKEKAKRGNFLSANQSIMIAELADVMLVQSDGKSMLLEKPGTYTYLQVKKLFSNLKPGGSSGFFSYVFEKFLAGGSSDDKQKVSAAVIRGKYAMLLPADSSFLFTTPVMLQWKPEQKNIPYRVRIRVHQTELDTVIRSKTSLTVPASMLQGDEAMLLEWSTIPSGSKQQLPTSFLYLIPAKKDKEIIQQQLSHLTTRYSKNVHLLHLMKKDLFERWLELYQLK
jgi:hypothetical protein